MTRDYAKPSKLPRQPRRWLLPTMLIIATCAMLFTVMKHHTTTQTKTPPKTALKTTESKTTPPKKTQFDFYAMLPKMQVHVKKPAAAGQMPIPKTHDPYYVIQIATSNNTTAVKNLIEELGVIGITAYQQSYKTAHGASTYKILTGPYLTKAAANNDESLLQINHYSHLLLTIRPS